MKVSNLVGNKDLVDQTQTANNSTATTQLLSMESAKPQISQSHRL
jgi:hypothetical protein